MRDRSRAFLLGTACLAAALLSPVAVGVGTPQAARAAVSPSISVADGSWLYPAFDPAVSRYAVHAQPDGTVSVTVSDAASVMFNGVPDADGAATFSDAQPGDEISVFIGDGDERRAYALYVLPASFPKLSTTATGAALQPGNVAVTLDRFDNVSPRYEAILDRHGVPAIARESYQRSSDLKMARSGELTIQRPTTTTGRTGSALVVLDDQFQEVRRLETTNLVHTDSHDSVLEADGSRWLLAYEPNPDTGLVDSVIQHVGADGTVDFQWSSAPYADETLAQGNADYSHINSIDVQPNGDVLASFRHLSSVFLIAGPHNDQHQPGTVIWKLGGRDSSFTFPPGDGGPCAQHSAELLPNGNVLMFDNGSTSFFSNLCVDPEAPTGPAIERPSTRVVEFALTGNEATVARTYGPGDRFAWFMGSAATLANGHVLIGWSADHHAIASETDANGSTLWALSDERWAAPDGPPPPAYFSYRAALVPARDGFDPRVTVDGPADGLTVAQGADVPVSFSCEDTGGSTLQSCDGPAGRRLDTTVAGTHTWQVTARDGVGRQTTVSRTYTVTAAPAPTSTTAPTTVPTAEPTTSPATSQPTLSRRPDLAVRTARGSWVGAGEVSPTPQRAVLRLRSTVHTLVVRLTNTGTRAGRMRFHGPRRRGRGAVVLTYRFEGEDRTSAVSRWWRTPRLAPGQSMRVHVRVTLRRTDPQGWRLPLRATGGGSRDRVVVSLRP